jgi:hypothetical protein
MQIAILPRRQVEVIKDGKPIFYVEPATAQTAQFWGIYEKEEDGCLRWMADADTREDAYRLASGRILEQNDDPASHVVETDAHLISAAQALREALEKCLEQIDQMRGMFPDDPEIDEAVQAAEEALDAAAGYPSRRAAASREAAPE